MDIPNLSSGQPPIKPVYTFSMPALVLVVLFSLATGFWISRFFPSNPTQNTTAVSSSSNKTGTPVNIDKIESAGDLKVGQWYGNTGKTFNDKAQGTLETGSINGEGTHILKRPGGDSQSVSLTSSSVDLDLFVDRKVEIEGETNASKKTGWLIDVGTIKILE